LPFYIEQTPLINLEFGIIPVVVDHSGISNIANNTFVRKGYPNPANTTVSIPFTMNQDEVVTVTLSDVAGQVLKTQVINAIGGQSMKATIAVNDLADGVYLYCVAANGQHSNGRIVVAH